MECGVVAGLAARAHGRFVPRPGHLAHPPSVLRFTMELTLLSEINSDDPLALMSYIGDAFVPGYVEQEKLHELLEKVRAEGE